LAPVGPTFGVGLRSGQTLARQVRQMPQDAKNQVARFEENRRRPLNVTQAFAEKLNLPNEAGMLLKTNQIIFRGVSKAGMSVKTRMLICEKPECY
jgi:hypothetical protein